MRKFTNPLNNIKIAAPCSADWSEMIGNERQRFCGECKLNVYNLSGMSQREAENLLLNSEGRLCVRFYKRDDGSILTKDCPVGWRAIKQRVSKTATAFASLVFTALSGIGLVNYFAKTDEPQMMGAISMSIENTSVIESSIEQTNSNVDIQDLSEPTMGKPYIQNMATTGVAVNVSEVRQHLRKKYKR
jgi:hypothetical protein